MNRLVIGLALLLSPWYAYAQIFGSVDAVSGPVTMVSADETTEHPSYQDKI